MTGALHGLRVVELGGIGPAPHAAMLLADLGADVVRVERPSGGLALGDPTRDVVLRGRRSVHADLRDPDDLAAVLALVDRADVLIDPFRPGVTDRLGLGPDVLADRNPRLVYARMTGWGADGPLADRAGHDLNYLSLTGVLHAIGSDEQPAVPLNVVGDYGGGSLYLAVGVLAALFERERSGRGQVVDAAIVDGVASLAQLVWSMRGQGLWQDRRRSNLLDGGAPFYDTYACADGGHVAVGAIEPQFYAALLDGLGLADEDLPVQFDLAGWAHLRARFAEVFLTRSRDEWAAVFAGTDACVTPVLSFDEAASHPHLAARGTIVEVDGLRQAAPAPRLSRTPASAGAPPLPGSTDLDTVRRDWQA
ncbi:MAG TPA: CaiB/BaiF CoA-transferase family protein [Egicoccus sp.]|nr:CaiB/BaiF CoA-transferase family protein [Egicoccus sp.]HSK24110.1 CaiB/BaiF CoA-transferase family protein [Egicoccus sp.]